MNFEILIIFAIFTVAILYSSVGHDKGVNDTGPLLEWTVSRNDGSYVLGGIPPGRYRLGIGIGGAFDAFGKNGQVFYPNTRDPEKAKIITIAERRPLRLNLHPPKLP